MKWIQKTFFALGTVNSVTVSYEDYKKKQTMETLNQIQKTLPYTNFGNKTNKKLDSILHKK